MASATSGAEERVTSHVSWQEVEGGRKMAARASRQRFEVDYDASQLISMMFFGTVENW